MDANQRRAENGGRVERLARARPDLPFIAPFMVYLLLLALKELDAPHWDWLFTLLRTVGGAAAIWVFRKHLPPWGKPHWRLATAAAVLVAAGWYYGQYLFNWLGVPHWMPLPLFGDAPDLFKDPRDELGDGPAFWTMVTLRILCASTTVAFVEELFWRAFLLRALIDWDDFERVPLGKFTWRSFLLTALISTLEHPANWAVSIPCWFAFNGLMYWKKSVLFLVVTHGLTNLFLYVWVIYQAVGRGNASAWMFW